MRLPTISSYGNYSSVGYGAHTLRVTVGNVTVWFSYQTAVAFQVLGQKMVICENVWTPTTGKHLNMIDPDKSHRVGHDEFQRLWSEHVTPALAVA